MITWMQRRKKYLIVILWVTVIAFVGAGFVGWGSYSYGKKSSSVATVGDREISAAAFHRQYGNILSYYNQILDGKVSQGQKRELQEIALNNLIDKALILNYGDELGLSATKEEVAQAIRSTPGFQNNGKFDKSIYIKALNNAHLKMEDYENQVKDDLVIGKINQLFQLPATALEIGALSAPVTMKDNLEIKVVYGKNQRVKITEEMKKKFYEKNKMNFLSQPQFDISYVKVGFKDVKISEALVKKHYEKNSASYLDEEGNIKSFEKAKVEVLEDLGDKITRKEVLKRGVGWKNGEVNPIVIKNVPLTNSIVPQEELLKLDSNATFKRSRPVKVKNGYIVFKIDKRIPPRQLTFKESEKLLTPVLEKEEREKKLVEVTEKMKKKLRGKRVGFVGMNDTEKLKDLTRAEASEFLGTLFTSKQKSGVVNLKEKAVIYKVLEQKLFEEKIDNADGNFARKTVEEVKNRAVMQDLLKELKNRYTIQRY